MRAVDGNVIDRRSIEGLVANTGGGGGSGMGVGRGSGLGPSSAGGVSGGVYKFAASNALPGQILAVADPAGGLLPGVTIVLEAWALTPDRDHGS